MDSLNMRTTLRWWDSLKSYQASPEGLDRETSKFIQWCQDNFLKKKTLRKMEMAIDLKIWPPPEEQQGISWNWETMWNSMTVPSKTDCSSLHLFFYAFKPNIFKTKPRDHSPLFQIGTNESIVQVDPSHLYISLIVPSVFKPSCIIGCFYILWWDNKIYQRLTKQTIKKRPFHFLSNVCSFFPQPRK